MPQWQPWQKLISDSYMLRWASVPTPSGYLGTVIIAKQSFIVMSHVPSQTFDGSQINEWIKRFSHPRLIPFLQPPYLDGHGALLIFLSKKVRSFPFPKHHSLTQTLDPFVSWLKPLSSVFLQSSTSYPFLPDWKALNLISAHAVCAQDPNHWVSVSYHISKPFC